MRQLLRQGADVTKRFVLRRPNDRRQQSVFNRHRNAEIDIRILENCVTVERGIDARHFPRSHHRRFQNKVVYRDLRSVRIFAGGFQFLTRFH